MPKEEDHKPEKGIIANATEIDVLTPPKAAQALPLEEKEPQAEFYNMAQGKGTNALARVTGNSFKIDPMAPDKARAEVDGVVIITNNINMTMNANTLRVYDILVSEMTPTLPHVGTTGDDVPLEAIDRARHIRLSIADYLRLCGKKDRKAARDQLNAAAKELYEISIEWDETEFIKGSKGNKKNNKHWKTRIIDTLGSNLDSPVKNGVLEVSFTMDLAKYLAQSPIMPHAQKLFSINQKKHPHAYYIGRELELHHNMNLGKPNENRISVKTLLKAAPDIPKYEDVMRTTKQVKRDIIDRIDASLIALRDEYGVLEEWHYCNPKGIELTDKQVEDYSYSEWSTWLVEYELADYPQQERKRLAKAKKATKKTNKKSGK